MKLRLAVIGSGIKARQYIETWIQRQDLEIVAVADLSEGALQAVKDLAEIQRKPCPSLYGDWVAMLEDLTAEGVASPLDAVYISSPHAFHAEQAVSALKAKVDVLLEKPMVMTVDEARQIITAREASGKELVVAYQGGLSPLVHQLARDVAQKTYGELVSINGTIWEEWATKYRNHWKQVSKISGGGFMFDTGAHLMNTVSMICGAEFKTISALMDHRDYPVDAVTAAVGRLDNGTLFTLHASGETIPVCQSRIELFFSEAIVRICAWGRWVEIERPGKAIERKEQESANNLMDIFNRVRAGELENPSPAEQGLKMATLWDAIKASAAAGGAPVNCD
ncbi:Gfo/Idh/MocA family protein [Microbulbifer sp.]|uniref:Gfo/Idh/MocA family protein n=1 Tax=Microbulbifer sp. TaxID=1908541 RepID=UPI003F3FF107